MNNPAGPEDRPLYLRFLPDFLFRHDQSPLLYVLKTWPLALLPSFALSALVGLLAPAGTRAPDIPVEGPVPLLLLIVVGPLLETLILAVMVLGLKRFVGTGPAVVISALLWAIGHSLAAPVWGLIVWWPFLIFSIALVTWRPRGIWVAIGLVTLIHGLQNAAAGLLLLASQSAAS